MGTRIRSIAGSAVLLATLVSAAGATRVSEISVVYASGQTFLTWKAPAGIGWTYRIYRSTSPPAPGDGPSHYVQVGSLRDSSWCDRRLSSLQGQTFPYVIPGAGALAADRGLFVYTCPVAAGAYWAVTCGSASTPVDTSLVPGSNATTAVALEWPDRPKPVLQRTLTVYYGPTGISAEVYTLWTADRATPFAPAMCNRPSVPYDCAVSLNAGGTSHGLMFHAHTRGGDFLTLNYGSMTPGEYVLTMDDYIPSDEANTYWFGFHQHYNIYGGNDVPVGGIVEDYTFRRVAYTIEWARRQFPVDTTRVYVMGNSMGGMVGASLALRRPDLIAASMVVVPLFDLSFEDDPDAACAFGVEGSQRVTCNLLFGTVQEALRTPDGTPVFDLLNGNKLVEAQAGRFVSPIIAFSGRYDSTMGWAEKPRFYETMRTQRAGGCFFFDSRTHINSGTAQWMPLQDFSSLYRYRTDLSFPAFSNCSANSDPGDGHATSGDSAGTINGFMEWDNAILDFPRVWSVTLFTRDLVGLYRAFGAPESLTVDVTPRRTQAFRLAPLQPVEYAVVRMSDDATVESGEAYSDADGIVTAPAVKVYRPGTRLTLAYFGPTAVAHDASTGISLSGLRNPMRGACELVMTWPGAGRATVELYDVSGRRVRDLFRATVTAGKQQTRFDPQGLHAGVYFLSARLGDRSLVRRVVIAP